ncbi:MAG: transposase [Elusimicrobia bacterium]|nr:transposase [Elusimicrobiota bacterium]
MAGQQTGFVPRDYDVFAGLDVDKTNISVTFVDHEMAIKSMSLPNDAENLLGYVAKKFPDKRVAFAYEAGPTGYGLHDRITAAGYPCMVVAPCMVPTARGHHVKTNRLDSQKISESLRGGQLKSIHVPSPSYRDLRHLIQLRDTCVRQATSTKLRIKGLLLFEGIPFPQPAGAPVQWSKSIVASLKTLACGGGVRFKLDQLIAALEFSKKQVLATTKEIRRASVRWTKKSTGTSYF